MGRETACEEGFGQAGGPEGGGADGRRPSVRPCPLGRREREGGGGRGGEGRRGGGPGAGPGRTKPSRCHAVERRAAAGARTPRAGRVVMAYRAAMKNCTRRLPIARSQEGLVLTPCWRRGGVASTPKSRSGLTGASEK